MTSTHLRASSRPSSDGPEPKPKKPRLDVDLDAEIVSFSAYTTNAQSHHFLYFSHPAGSCVTRRTGESSATLGGMLACQLSQTSSRYRRPRSGAISVFCNYQMERFTFEKSTKRCTPGCSVVPETSKDFPGSLLLGSLESVRLGLPERYPYLKPSILSIGKSYFAVYALLRRLAAGLPVMFSNKHGFTYWFHEQGLWRLPTESFAPDDLSLISYDPAYRVWSLVDPPDEKQPLKGHLFSDVGIFYAVFASPDNARFKNLVEKDDACLWLLSPWDNNELRHLYVSLIINESCTWSNVLPGSRQKG